MAKSKQPSAKMGKRLTAIRLTGMRLKNPQTKRRRRMPAHQNIATPHRRLVVPSSNAGSLITFAALALSIFAVGLAGFAIWQQRQNTADIAALMPVNNSDPQESVNVANLGSIIRGVVIQVLLTGLPRLKASLPPTGKASNRHLPPCKTSWPRHPHHPPITSKIMILAVMPKRILPPFAMIWINALPRLRRHWPTKPHH